MSRRTQQNDVIKNLIQELSAAGLLHRIAFLLAASSVQDDVNSDAYQEAADIIWEVSNKLGV